MIVSDYETFIPEKSPIIGKTIGEIEKESGIKIEHYGGCSSFIYSCKPSPEEVVKDRMFIKFKADVSRKKLEKFCTKYNLP